MHVIRVELENIKSFSKADYRFERGTTAITGENGAGKTTIIESIAWALFDSLEYSKDDFLKRGRKKGSVRITFQSDFDDRQYVVYRDTGNGYYIYDPALHARIAEKKNDVGKYLARLLGVEPGTDLKSLYRSAIGVPQGTFTADFLGSAAVRKAAFDKLLKVEEYRDAADRLRETVKFVSDRLAKTQVEIAGAEGRLTTYADRVESLKRTQKDLAELRAALAGIRKDIESHEREVEKHGHAQEKLTAARTAFSSAEHECRAAKRRFDDLTAECARAETAANRLEQIESEHRRHLDSLERLQALESLRVERDALLTDKGKNEILLSNANKDVSRISKAVEEAISAQKQIDELIPAVTEQRHLETTRSELREQRVSAIADQKRFNRLEAELGDLRKQLILARQQVNDAEQSAPISAQLEGLEDAARNVEAELALLEKNRSVVAQLQTQRAGHLTEISRVEEAILSRDRLIAEVESISAVAAEIPALNEKDQSIREEIATIRATLARDKKFHAEVKNGLCPILSERCLNIKEGQTLEQYFSDTFETGSGRLKVLEGEQQEYASSLKIAREAERRAAGLGALRTQSETDKEQLDRKKLELSTVEEQVATLSTSTSLDEPALKRKLAEVRLSIKSSREASRKFATLEPLKLRLTEIESEGVRKRDEHTALAGCEKRIESLDQELRTIELRLNELNDPISKVARLEPEAARIESRSAELVSGQSKVVSITGRIAELELSLERFPTLSSDIGHATQERESTAAAHREFVSIEALALTAQTRRSETETAKSECDAKQEHLKQVEAKITLAASAYDSDMHAASQISFIRAREDASATSARIGNLATREQELSNEIASLEDIKNQLIVQNEQKLRIEKTLALTEFIRETLKAAGPHVTRSYVYNVSIEANLLFREITGDAGRTLSWTEDYEIILEEDGFERSFQNLSGGEQMAAALAVRLALLKQLSDIRIAFFDEPTTNMDAERRERLAQEIGRVDNFDQLFVISHDDAFEENVDNVVHVRRDETPENAADAA